MKGPAAPPFARGTLAEGGIGRWRGCGLPDRYAGPDGEGGRSGEANGSNGCGDDLTSAWGGGREHGRLDVRAEGDDPADASAKEDGDVRAWEDGHMTSAPVEEVETSTRGKASEREHLWGKTLNDLTLAVTVH